MNSTPPTGDLGAVPTETAGPHPGPSGAGPPPSVAIRGFRVLRPLGAGGMGAVYEAVEEAMQRRVALKVLGRHLTGYEEAGDRFKREAWIAGKLNHPNLVRVFGRGEDGDLSYFSMELVDGGSLHDVLRNLKQGGRDDRLGLVFESAAYPAWVLRTIVEAARGLDHAHRQGVVHRDIKPMNVLLGLDPPGVKVGDFGLAMDAGLTRLTSAGAVMGTFAYMAPEQIRGQQDRIGPRTDIYALGVTLFEALTLQLPFTGRTQQLYLDAVLTKEARRPSRINERVGRDLEIVLNKALEKDPAGRYADMAAFADDLENVLHFRPIAARPASVTDRLAKWARRRPVHAALAAILALGLPITGALGVRDLRHRRLVAELHVQDWKEEAGRFLLDERFEQALQPLDRILASRPDDEDALTRRSLSYARLAMAAHEQGRIGDLQRRALADIDRVAARLPDERWPHRVRGFLLESFGRELEAGEEERLAARLPDTTPGFYAIQIDGILAMMAGDHPAALEKFGELIRRRPDAADARLWRASVYEDLGRTAQAMTDYEVAAALKPGDLLSRLNLARLKTESGLVDEGAALYAKALELAPDDARAREGLASNLLEQGRARFGAGDRAAAGDLFRRAEAEARMALERDPDLPWARVNLGASLVEQNRLLENRDAALLGRAIAEFEQVVKKVEAGSDGERDKVLLSALTNECDALIQARELGRAADVCRRVTESWPDIAAAHYNLAAVHALSGRRSESLDALRRDIELGDTDWQYLEADPWFASLRGDPAFQELIVRMRKPAPGA